MKKFLLFGTVILLLASCAHYSTEPYGESLIIVRDNWKAVSGILHSGGARMLPLVYDSIVHVSFNRPFDPKQNDFTHVIAYKDGAGELWKLWLYSAKAEKLAEGHYFYTIGSAYRYLIKVDSSGKKSVYGVENPCAPYDEIYPAENEYFITEKDGLFGYNGVPPIYRKVYIARSPNAEIFILTSDDGTVFDSYNWGTGQRKSVLTLDEIEEYIRYDAEDITSRYSFSGWNDFILGEDFFSRLDGGHSYNPEYAAKIRANRRR